MKLSAVVCLICLMLAGTVSAKLAEPELGVSIENPNIASGIYAQLAVTDCSDDSASVGTPTGKGDLNVDSIPDGASVSLDGSPWTYKHCIGGYPPICFTMPIHTPYTGNVETGSHSITIALSGYKSYSGTVKICSQKVTYVDKSLTAIPTTAPTTAVTTTATTTTTTATATSATTTTTTATATSATTSPAETATTSVTTSPAATAATSATTSVTEAATPPPVQAATSSAASMVIPAGSGSLSVTTAPAGAAVYIDGVQRGISPATIPGLAPGSHTVLLKLDGYQDLSTPVSITAGTTNEFSTGLAKLTAEAASTAAVPEKTQTPGFGAAAALCAAGVLLLRKIIP